MFPISNTLAIADQVLKAAEVVPVDYNNIHWELYDSEKGAQSANKVLSNKLKINIERAKQKIQKGSDKEKVAKEVRDRMYQIMERYRKLGARDTEPETVLVQIIRQELGADIDRWS